MQLPVPITRPVSYDGTRPLKPSNHREPNEKHNRRSGNVKLILSSLTHVHVNVHVRFGAAALGDATELGPPEGVARKRKLKVLSHGTSDARSLGFRYCVWIIHGCMEGHRMRYTRRCAAAKL